MTRKRSFLFHTFSKTLLILAMAGFLIVPVPERLNAEGEPSVSSAKVEETNTGLKAKLSVSVTVVDTVSTNNEVNKISDQGDLQVVDKATDLKSSVSNSSGGGK